MYNSIPDRPISQNELLHNRNLNRKKLRLSNVTAWHPKCNHFYFVKKHGRKEKVILENDDNIGNCSVCWKLGRNNSNNAYNHELVCNYCYYLNKEPEVLTRDLVDLEAQYYTWLYDAPRENRKV